MIKNFIFILILFAIFSACSNNNTIEQELKTNKIKVAVFAGNGAGAVSVIETYEALRIDTGIFPSIIKPVDIISGKLKNIDVIIFPGGSGSKELTSLGEQGKQIILDFVKIRGKGAVGICAGGFLFSTTKGYPSLKLISATEWDRVHYNKGRALVELIPTAAGLKIFPELKDQSCFLQYYDGPVLMPSDSGRSGTMDYVELAQYKTDIQIHKDFPSDVTPGKTFLLKEVVGKGRAIVSAGHPESTPGMRWMIPRMARWAANKTLVSYNKKWIRPELNDSAILFRKELVKLEKKLFWQLHNDTIENRLDAMQKLYELRSRPAVRWNKGMLRSNNAKVRAKAAKLLLLTEYTDALADLESALKLETDTNTRNSIQDAIDFLSKF